MIFGKQNGFANVDLNNFPGDAGIRIEGVAADDQSGRSVSAAGDVNGDGVDDLIVGAPFADPPQRRQLRRELCLFCGWKARPVAPDQRPEASLAWWRGNPYCEA